MDLGLVHIPDPVLIWRGGEPVLALVAEGAANRQVARQLHISPETASVHVSNILAELGAAGRGEAAAVAHRLGVDRET